MCKPRPPSRFPVTCSIPAATRTLKPTDCFCCSQCPYTFASSIMHIARRPKHSHLRFMSCYFVFDFRRSTHQIIANRCLWSCAVASLFLKVTLTKPIDPDCFSIIPLTSPGNSLDIIDKGEVEFPHLIPLCS